MTKIHQIHQIPILLPFPPPYAYIPIYLYTYIPIFLLPTSYFLLPTSYSSPLPPPPDGHSYEPGHTCHLYIIRRPFRGLACLSLNFDNMTPPYSPSFGLQNRPSDGLNESQLSVKNT